MRVVLGDDIRGTRNGRETELVQDNRTRKYSDLQSDILRPSRQVLSGGIEQGLNKVVLLQTRALDKATALPHDLCRHKAHWRRIRVVSAEEDIEEVFKRCMGESPSGQLFSDKALSVPGWKHIEGSVQRQFQKVVEMTPSTIFHHPTESG
ncbi:hypothetical protein FIBSPDRAFT_960440 [Athelia psychrophila]|uniref:Uncharacterized protein n=1 Tax=Athelia psychrophila TaxID=1759441 RepID=A0A166CCK2_9AGAM|nr:hypothetical protein FIBSPDRAFT_960440 [Fibularhizoctonia sp. CBS 109695]